MNTRKSLIVAGLMACVATLTTTSAVAEKFKSAVSTCTSDFNCGAKAQSRRSLAVDDNGSWTGQFYAKAGECLRVEVIREKNDMTMTVVSPIRGDTWYDDDGGIGLAPLVVIDPVQTQGYHTVVVHNFSPARTAGIFDLVAMRYDSGNPTNCQFPTPTTSPGPTMKAGPEK